MPDQRKHLRLPVESRTFIELISPDISGAESGKVVTCKTLNISRGGLQVMLPEQLTVGAILQIGIELPGAASPLYLAGEVRWCLRNDIDTEHPYSAGFKLLNANSSDFHKWVDLVAAMEA